MTKSTRYYEPSEVPVVAWQIQGSVYDSLHSAQFAAAKLYTNITNVGVLVKSHNGQFALFFWCKEPVTKPS